MIDDLSAIVSDPDLLLERITHSANQIEKMVRASADPIDLLSRIIAANDVVFVLWNEPAGWNSTPYAILKGRRILGQIKAGGLSRRIAFSDHPLDSPHDTLSAVGAFCTPGRVSVFSDARTGVDAETVDYMART